MCVASENGSRNLISRIWIPDLFGLYVDPAYAVCRQISLYKFTINIRREIHSESDL